MNELSPRRWLLISREVDVPDQDEGSGRWSLDHLFLDQDGIPTLVEVKRSSDTRIRRAVVGQMMDYAANGVVYWPLEKLRAEFEAAHEDPDEKVRALLDDDGADVDVFWQQVKTNLQAGRIRLLFVADQVPNELRRIVEFLNEQMDPAEVLAVAIRQYVGEDHQTLVPQVMGQTAQAQSRKAVRPGSTKQWDEETFFQALRLNDSAAIGFARRMYAWARKTGRAIRWGKGTNQGSCSLCIHHRGGSLIALWTGGEIEFRFSSLRSYPPFDEDDRFQALVGRVKAIPGAELGDDPEHKKPNFPMARLDNEDSWKALQEMIAWFDAQ